MKAPRSSAASTAGCSGILRSANSPALTIPSARSARLKEAWGTLDQKVEDRNRSRLSCALCEEPCRDCNEQRQANATNYCASTSAGLLSFPWQALRSPCQAVMLSTILPRLCGAPSSISWAKRASSSGSTVPTSATSFPLSNNSVILFSRAAVTST